jgi:4'-phosphopantetheinyl transferase
MRRALRKQAGVPQRAPRTRSGAIHVPTEACRDLMPITEPCALPTPTHEVSLWWCSLALDDADRDRLEWSLSAAERHRMQRFGNDALRSRYLAGRSALRGLLGLRLGVAPDAVPIVTGPRGRPQLEAHPDLDFNVSHTGGAALIGIGHAVRIGVDIERTDRAINAAGIARKFMTAGERADPGMADPEEARRRVLRLWTCKEAMSKATGDALSAPFSRIHVEVTPRLRLADGPPPYRPAHWRLHPVAAPEGYLATLAIWRERNASRPSSA